MKNLDEVMNWRENSKYNAGKADLITTIFNLHENSLPEDVKDWLHKERMSRREDSLKALDNAIKALKEGSEE